MSTIRRDFRAVPYRSANDTWEAIVSLLTQNGKNASAKVELDKVAGVAASIITDGYPKEAPIVVTCDGPRTRIYCLFDEDATEGSDANEEPLNFDALSGNWSLSLPCHEDELNWINSALKKHSSKITARNLENGISLEEQSKSTVGNLVIDVEGFLKP